MPAIPAQLPAPSHRRAARPRVGAFAGEPSPSGGVRWRWSDAMFVIHGFTPGDVQPTTELWLAHVASKDRAGVLAVLDSTPSTSVALVYRMRDAQARDRLCVLVLAEGGRSGSLVDLTEEWRQTAARTANEAIRSAAVRTAPLDQAMGVLMAAHEIDQATARDAITAWSADTHQDASVAARALVYDSVHGGALAAELGVYCRATAQDGGDPRRVRSLRTSA